MPSSEQVADDAEFYLKLGWSVIPIHRADKRPAVSSWKRFQESHASQGLAIQWFMEADEEFNIGIVAGKVSGLAVVDFDGYTGEDPVAFLRAHNLPTNAPIALTGKGFHVYYRHPGGIVRNGVRVGVLSGVAVDLRGDGGYVVAPHSVHETGRQYRWLKGHEPYRLEDLAQVVFPTGEGWDVLPEAFTKTVDRGEAQTTPQTASEVLEDGDEIAGLMHGLTEGGRNQACAKLTGYWLRVTDGNERAAFLAVKAWNQLNDPPLPYREMLGTFRSMAATFIPKAGTDEPDSGTTVLDAREWAAAVRDIPPRRGVDNPAIPTMDELGGIVERDLVILAGRPGMGKSTAAWGTVVDVSIKQKLPTVVFSTEMTANDVARWVASRMFQTPVRDLRPDQWNDALRKIAASPITMCDQGALTVNGIVEVVKARPDTKLVIVDHIQRINGGRGESRNLQLGAIAKALKSLAKDNACTVLALSQLNRVGEQGERPRLENLRESGDLEQEADAVIFLWSSHEDPTANPLPVEFYLAKNRHGALAQVDCMFHKALKTFEAMDFQARLKAVQQELRNKEKLRELIEEGA